MMKLSISAVVRQLRSAPVQPARVRRLLPPRAHEAGRTKGRRQGRRGKAGLFLTFCQIDNSAQLIFTQSDQDVRFL